jgi:hypothetical protein
MRIGVVGVIAMLVAVPARAWGQGSADAGLETYELTMPNIRKMAAAYERLDAALTANPSVGRKVAEEEGVTSVADVIAKLDAEPVVKQAIAAAGITTRDMVLTQFALFTAGVNDFAARAGAPPPTAPAAAANLELFQQNRAELEQITARLKRLPSWQALQAGEEGVEVEED